MDVVLLTYKTPSSLGIFFSRKIYKFSKFFFIPLFRFLFIAHIFSPSYESLPYTPVKWRGSRNSFEETFWNGGGGSDERNDFFCKFPLKNIRTTSRGKQHTENDYQALKFKCHRSDPGRIIRKYFFLCAQHHHPLLLSTVIAVRMVSLASMDGKMRL